MPRIGGREGVGGGTWAGVGGGHAVIRYQQLNQCRSVAQWWLQEFTPGQGDKCLLNSRRPPAAKSSPPDAESCGDWAVPWGASLNHSGSHAVYFIHCAVMQQLPIGLGPVPSPGSRQYFCKSALRKGSLEVHCIVLPPRMVGDPWGSRFGMTFINRNAHGPSLNRPVRRVPRNL